MQTEQEGGSECTTMLKKERKKKKERKSTVVWENWPLMLQHCVRGAWYYENMAYTARS